MRLEINNNNNDSNNHLNEAILNNNNNKEKEEDKNNIQINKLVLFFDFLFFGNGKYYFIPLFFGFLFTLSIIILMITSPSHLGLGQGWLNISMLIQYFLELCILIELTVNLIFGYQIMKQYKEWLKKCSYIYKVSLKQLYFYFEISAYINLILFIITGCLLVLSENFEQKNGRNQTPATIFYDLGYCIFVYGISYYLCGIWISISCVLTHIISQTIDSQLTTTTLFTHEIQSTIASIYQEMSIISILWKYNHLVRILTGLVLSSTLLYTGKQSYEEGFMYSSIFHIWSALLYYSAMWMTVFCSGYVNDYLYDKIAFRLYELDINREYTSHVVPSLSSFSSSSFSMSLSSQQQQQQQRVSQPKYTYEDYLIVKNSLQLNLLTIRTSVGLRFMGVAMTKEKTVAVGSLIFTLISVIIFRVN